VPVLICACLHLCLFKIYVAGLCYAALKSTLPMPGPSNREHGTGPEMPP
jgi:hypothetical protein